MLPGHIYVAVEDVCRHLPNSLYLFTSFSRLVTRTVHSTIELNGGILLQVAVRAITFCSQGFLNFLRVLGVHVGIILTGPRGEYINSADQQD